nr:immunoglobulin heavy chain junction region [Mus musculus]
CAGGVKGWFAYW